MDQIDIRNLLEQVKNGEVTTDEAVEKLKIAPFEDLGYANVDHHRGVRQGVPEVIFGAGKTPEQIIGIVRAMQSRGEHNILITRLSAEAAAAVSGSLELGYDPVSRIGLVGKKSQITAEGTIIIATGGTSDIPVAEEAAQVAEALGNKVERVYDVGVAGLHRLLSRLELLMQAKVVVAVAGMEGALPSVIGGLVDCPVIAVPTSIGYGANFNGLAALLSMLNSCASGISVVNIDNGFGAGYLASMINHIGGKAK